MNRKSHISIARIILALVFLLIIYASPLITLFGEKATISNSEKRKLATFPSLQWTFKSIKTVPSRFEDYFNDHFGFRSALIYCNNYIMSHWLRISPVPSVVISEKGWLFDGRLSYKEDFRGLSTISPLQLETWKNDLAYKQQWMANLGIKYFFVVAPAKSSIYPEYFPSRYNKVKEFTPLDQLLLYLKNHSNMNIVDLRPALRKAKQNDLLYFPNDTHWNYKGAFVAYQTIMENVMHLFPEVSWKNPFSFDYKVKKAQEGDLSIMLRAADIGSWDRVPSFSLNTPCARRINIKSDDKERTKFKKMTLPFLKICEKAPPLRVLVVRDSMFIDVEPYLSERFQLASYVWLSPPLRAYDVSENIGAFIQKFRPQVVIEEKSEKFLFEMTSPEMYHFNHAAPLFKHKKYKEAIVQLREAVRIKPEYEDAYSLMGSAMCAMGHYTEGVEQYVKALKINPEDKVSAKALGNARAYIKRVDHQIKRLKNFVNYYPDSDLSDLQCKIGDLMKSKGAWRQAREHYQKALSINPQSIAPLNKMVMLDLSIDKYGDAIQTLKKIIGRTPKNYTAYYNIACLYAIQNKIDASLEWLKRAIDQGFNNWGKIQKDHDLRNIRNSPGYQNLIQNHSEYQ